MRPSTVLAALLALVGTPAASLASAPLPPPDGPRAKDVKLPRLGAILDAGVPSGAGLLVQVRVLDPLRLQAGPMWSGVGWGARGGVVLAPLRGALSPALELEGGYGFRADLSFLARRSDVPAELRPVLAHARYWYAAGYVGLDAGSPRGAAFFVRVGLARLLVTAPETARSVRAGGTLEIGDATLDAVLPCAKLGLSYWF